MAVSVIASGANQVADSTNVAIASGTGTDRCLYLLTSIESAFTNSATYNSVALTQIASFGNTRLYRLINPSQGTFNLRIVSSNGSQVDYAYAFLAGVDQTTPNEAVGTNSGSGASSNSGAITVPTDGLGLGFLRTAWVNDASQKPVIVAPSILRGSYWAGNSGNNVAGGSRDTTGSVGWTHGSVSAWNAYRIPVNAVLVPGVLGGNVDLNAAEAAGTLTTSASDLGGNITADPAVAAGSMGSQPGTVTSEPLRDKFTGVVLSGVTIPKVAYVRVSDMAAVLTVVDALTNGAGRLVTSNAALVAGTKYLVVTCNSDGSAYGAEVYTAT